MPVKTIKMHKVNTDDPKTFGKADDYKTYGLNKSTENQVKEMFKYQCSRGDDGPAPE